MARLDHGNSTVVYQDGSRFAHVGNRGNGSPQQHVSTRVHSAMPVQRSHRSGQRSSIRRCKIGVRIGMDE